MKIPNKYYIHFWVKNSLMAMATGLAVGMLTPLPVVVILLAFLIYQVAVYQYFCGKLKGHFEYNYREFLIDNAAKSLVEKSIGIPEFLWDYPGQHYSEILAKSGVQNDPNLQSLAYLKLSQAARKEYDCRKEIEYLRMAVSLRPDDLIANYRLANALERAGNGQAAISAYQAALKDPFIDTEKLKEFISTQIKRVETKGPSKKPPIPGLRYMIS